MSNSDNIVILIMAIVFIFITIISQACSEQEVVEPIDATYENSSTYFLFPGDGDGKVYLIKPSLIRLLSAWTRTDNSYWLYTRLNSKEPQQLIINHKESVVNSNFDSSKPTVFISHGWKGSATNNSSKTLTSGFLENGDVNVIVLNYEADANMLYALAVMAATEIGRSLGEFIYWLTSIGLALDKTHLVGFSLGAHIVGLAGRFNNGTIRRITALDPAGPLWYDNRDRIQSTDARYVEVIHTNMRLFGYNGKIGDADFYPNGGMLMPECELSSCSHSQSWYYLAETLKCNNFLAKECENMNQVKANACNGSIYPMGNSDLTKNRTGIFRVNTMTLPPTN